MRAQRCVQAITVNGVATGFVGSGAAVSFSTSGLKFSTAGAEDVAVVVRATDCDGSSSSAGFVAHHDSGPPVIAVDTLQLAPAVNVVVQAPYRLSGSTQDRSLSGLAVGNQTIIARPTGTPGVWSFAVDVPLQRQQDRTLTIEAWDAAGQRSTQELVLRLNTQLNLEILTPRAGTQLLVGTQSIPLEVSVRALGMASGDVIHAQFDSLGEQTLPRTGDTASAVLSVPPTPGVRTLSIRVHSAAGATLAQGSVSIQFNDEANIPLQIVSQDPAADSGNVEANTPITLHFNRAVDPSKLTVAVVETVHGKLFAEQPAAADLTQLSAVGLIDVNRNRAEVPGSAQNFPENRMITFYPSRDYAYGATVFADVSYDGAELAHSKFAVRPLPTLIHGFVANQMVIPLQGIEISLPDIGRAAISNDDGNWNFRFGDPRALRIPPGRYRAVINPGRKNQRFGTIERYIQIGDGLGYAGTILLPELNGAEPFRHIATGLSTAAVLAGGDLQLDLTQATVVFPDGLPEGDVHAQFLSGGQLGHISIDGARPDWAFNLQPGGVTVSGAVSVSIQLPKLDQSYDYVDELSNRMLLVGLDAKSLQSRLSA